jgi:hypothetical protein
MHYKSYHVINQVSFQLDATLHAYGRNYNSDFMKSSDKKRNIRWIWCGIALNRQWCYFIYFRSNVKLSIIVIIAVVTLYTTLTLKMAAILFFALIKTEYLWIQTIRLSIKAVRACQPMTFAYIYLTYLKLNTNQQTYMRH